MFAYFFLMELFGGTICVVVFAIRFFVPLPRLVCSMAYVTVGSATIIGTMVLAEIMTLR